MNKNKLSIIFFGDGLWAHKALKLLLKENFDIKFIVVRNDYRDPELIKLAQLNNIPSGWHKNVNSEEFLSELRKYNSNLAVSMSFNQIIKRKTFEKFEHGFINCHAGKLPFYRGRNILNWALINDEKEIGVTCHYIDEGIDTGDIIFQQTFVVSDSDNYQTVLKKAIDSCPKVLVESIQMIDKGLVNRKKQPAQGSYFIARKEGDEFIDWEWSSRRIYNFVRAITSPGPLGQTWVAINGEYYKVLIKTVEQIENSFDYICAEGAVIGMSDGNPIIKTGDNCIVVNEYELIGISRKKLRIGDRLGLNLNLVLSGKMKFHKPT